MPLRWSAMQKKKKKIIIAGMFGIVIAVVVAV
jgi:hypothetical protein